MHASASSAVVKYTALVAGDPSVVLVVVGDDGVAGRHRFDERRIRPTDRVTVEIGDGVEPQGGDRLGVVDRPEEDDLVARRVEDRSLVGISGRVGAEHRQLHAATAGREARTSSRIEFSGIGGRSA